MRSEASAWFGLVSPYRSYFIDSILRYLECHVRRDNLLLQLVQLILLPFVLCLVSTILHTVSPLPLSLFITLSLSLSLSLPPTSEGHGTHVSGSVAGNSLGVFGEMDGMAPDAKISFFDIGNTHPCRPRTVCCTACNESLVMCNM